MLFLLSGILNTHNCRIWSDHNHHCIKETQLHSPQICVWMGISAKFALQPFFFEGTVNSENYLKLLNTHVIPQLKKRRSSSRKIFLCGVSNIRKRLDLLVAVGGKNFEHIEN